MYIRIYFATSYLGGCPHVGRPGVLGYVLEALRYIIDAEFVREEGRALARFNHKPFVIPTLVGCPVLRSQQISNDATGPGM